MTDETLPAVKNHLLDHAEEKPAPYQVKNTDPYLVDATVEKISSMLGGKGLRAVDRKEGIQSMSAILGLGDEGEKFHELQEHEQRQIMIDALNAPTLPMLNEKVLVGLELKPALPVFTGPAGPAFAPMGPSGPGMGGMRPQMLQPTPPGGLPPGYPQPPLQPPAFDPYTGQPLQPHYPATAYPAYPPQPYPPQAYPPSPYPADANHAQGGPYQGYAQPHPYPSYPVPPQPPAYGYPPQPGMPPHNGAPGTNPYWPPQQPGAAPPGAPYPYPPQQAAWPPPPLVVDAEEVKDDGSSDGSDKVS